MASEPIQENTSKPTLEDILKLLTSAPNRADKEVVQKAKKFIDKALEYLPSIRELHNSNCGLLLGRLAHAYVITNDFGSAEFYYLEAENYLTTLLNGSTLSGEERDNAMEVEAFVLHGCASLYSYSGQRDEEHLKKGLDCRKKAYNIRLDLQGAWDIGTINTQLCYYADRADLAIYQNDQLELAAVQSDSEKAINFLHTLSPTDYKENLLDANRARFYHLLGKVKIALNSIRNVPIDSDSIIKDFNSGVSHWDLAEGKKHPEKARCLMGLGKVYRGKKDEDIPRSIVYYQQAFEILNLEQNRLSNKKDLAECLVALCQLQPKEASYHEQLGEILRDDKLEGNFWENVRTSFSVMNGKSQGMFPQNIQASPDAGTVSNLNNLTNYSNIV